MTGPTGSPVFQIHPSVRCNLACAHCYSSSSPWASRALDPAVVRDAIRDAAELGYGTISISGGEPLLYPALAELLIFCKSLGLTVTITTNGTLLEGRRLDQLVSLVDVLAISLDGNAAAHDMLRRRTGAYERLIRGLDRVRERGLAFGFVHTLTKQSWEHVEGIVDFAAGVGAQLVQIHPLEQTGRAREQLPYAACDDITLAQVYILALALNARYAGKPVVQYDVLHVATMMDFPEVIYGGQDEVGAKGRCAEHLAVLVLEADGTIVPMTFGFGRSYRICNVNSERLRDAWPQFAREDYSRFRNLCRHVYQKVTAPGSPRFVNWYEVLHDASQDNSSQTNCSA
jgi:Fe-coproporphyrin III synthase